jgi:hypothetical protein
MQEQPRRLTTQRKSLTQGQGRDGVVGAYLDDDRRRRR